MWIVVGVSGKQKPAENMAKALEEEGLLVQLKNVSAGSKSPTFEVLVLESESDAAREILLDKGL